MDKPFNTKAQIKEDCKTIVDNGDHLAVAKKLGFSHQRVLNWKTRGIPEIIRVRNKWLRRKGETFE